MKAFPERLATGAPGRRERWGEFLQRRAAGWVRPARTAGRLRAPAALAPGDLVEVRSADAIARTLDDAGALAGCAFGRGQYQHCGKRYRVARRVERFFDEAQLRMLRARDLVLLEGVTCDGATSGEPTGCDRTCLYYWRAEWLERVEEGAGATRGGVVRAVAPSVEEPWTWYLARRARGLADRALRLARREPPRAGPPAPGAPSCRLRPGDRVRIRSAEEIRRTLDPRGWLADCVMGPGMFEHCGREARVLKRLASFYDEGPGRMVYADHVYALEGLRCDGAGHMRPGCDRSCVYFWRGEWLELLRPPQG